MIIMSHKFLWFENIGIWYFLRFIDEKLFCYCLHCQLHFPLVLVDYQVFCFHIDEWVFFFTCSRCAWIINFFVVYCFKLLSCRESMLQNEFWERISKEREIFYNLKVMSECEQLTVSTFLYCGLLFSLLFIVRVEFSDIFQIVAVEYCWSIK